MEILIKHMQRIGLNINKVCKIVLGIQMIVLTVIVLLQVFLRVGGISINWATEFCCLLFIWMTMLGATIASFHLMHIGVNLLTDRLKGKARKYLLLLSNIILIVCLALLTISGLQYTIFQAPQLGTAVKLSMAFFYSSYPICGLLMIYYAVLQLLETVYYGEAIRVPDDCSMEAELMGGQVAEEAMQ